eukprot:4089618-Amphidinium_carterae.1
MPSGSVLNCKVLRSAPTHRVDGQKSPCHNGSLGHSRQSMRKANAANREALLAKCVKLYTHSSSNQHATPEFWGTSPFFQAEGPIPGRVSPIK